MSLYALSTFVFPGVQHDECKPPPNHHAIGTAVVHSLSGTTGLLISKYVQSHSFLFIYNGLRLCIFSLLLSIDCQRVKPDIRDTRVDDEAEARGEEREARWGSRLCAHKIDTLTRLGASAYF